MAGSTLTLKPWEDNPFPKTKKLEKLHRWIKPLIDEEIEYEKNGIKFKEKNN